MKLIKSSGNVFADLGLPRAQERQAIARKFAGHKDGLKLFLAACAAISASGCAPHVRFVSTYCISKDTQLPAEPPRVKGQLTGQADSDLKIVAGSAIRLRAWGSGLEQILEGCREK